MSNVLLNEIEMKINYYYDSNAINVLDHTRNLEYSLGVSTMNDNRFDYELNKMIQSGIIEKVYDFIEGGFREGVYSYVDEKAQISFHGNNHMGLKIYHCY